MEKTIPMEENHSKWRNDISTEGSHFNEGKYFQWESGYSRKAGSIYFRIHGKLQ